jgi:hypothetical protein
MADGSTVDCTLIDVSATGVAVSTPLKPDIGLPLAVGQLVGKVVRHLDEGGFAVQFLSVQDESIVEKLLQPL